MHLSMYFSAIRAAKEVATALASAMLAALCLFWPIGVFAGSLAVLRACGY
jgi:hypothetical protein